MGLWCGPASASLVGGEVQLLAEFTEDSFANRLRPTKYGSAARWFSWAYPLLFETDGMRVRPANFASHFHPFAHCSHTWPDP